MACDDAPVCMRVYKYICAHMLTQSHVCMYKCMRTFARMKHPDAHDAQSCIYTHVTATHKIIGNFQRFSTAICTSLLLEVRRSDSHLFCQSQWQQISVQTNTHMYTYQHMHTHTVPRTITTQGKGASIPAAAPAEDEEEAEEALPRAIMASIRASSVFAAAAFGSCAHAVR